MNVFLILLFCYLFGKAAWKTILKKGAYPLSVKWYLKWIHAFILILLATITVFAIDELICLIRFYPNIGNDSAVKIARIIAIISGLVLPIICDRMAKRQRQALKWYFIVWPSAFMSANYVVFASVGVKYESGIKIIAFVFFVLLLATLIFYMIESVQRALFITEPIHQRQAKRI